MFKIYDSDLGEYITTNEFEIKQRERAKQKIDTKFNDNIIKDRKEDV